VTSAPLWPPKAVPLQAKGKPSARAQRRVGREWRGVEWGGEGLYPVPLRKKETSRRVTIWCAGATPAHATAHLQGSRYCCWGFTTNSVRIISMSFGRILRATRASHAAGWNTFATGPALRAPRCRRGARRVERCRGGTGWWGTALAWRCPGKGATGAATGGWESSSQRVPRIHGRCSQAQAQEQEHTAEETGSVGSRPQH